MCLWMVLLYLKKVGITTKSMMRTRMLRTMMARGDLCGVWIRNTLLSKVSMGFNMSVTYMP